MNPIQSWGIIVLLIILIILVIRVIHDLRVRFKAQANRTRETRNELLYEIKAAQFRTIDAVIDTQAMIAGTPVTQPADLIPVGSTYFMKQSSTPRFVVVVQTRRDRIAVIDAHTLVYSEYSLETFHLVYELLSPAADLSEDERRVIRQARDTLSE